MALRARQRQRPTGAPAIAMVAAVVVLSLPLPGPAEGQRSGLHDDGVAAAGGRQALQWWDPSFHFKLGCTVSAGAYDRDDVTATLRMDLAAALGGLGVDAAQLDPGSLRLVELEPDGRYRVVDPSIGGPGANVHPFDVAWADAAATPPRGDGEVVVVLDGLLAQGSSRDFEMYFDLQSFPHPAVAAPLPRQVHGFVVQDDGVPWQVDALSTDLSMAAYYGYGQAEINGLVPTETHTASTFLLQATDGLHLVVGLDDGEPNDGTDAAVGHVGWNVSGLPAGSAVAVSDDPDELRLGQEPGSATGRWEWFDTKTDGGAMRLALAPTDAAKVRIEVAPLGGDPPWKGIDRWTFGDGDGGTVMDLDLGSPLTLVFDPIVTTCTGAERLPGLLDLVPGPAEAPTEPIVHGAAPGGQTVFGIEVRVGGPGADLAVLSFSPPLPLDWDAVLTPAGPLSIAAGSSAQLTVQVLLPAAAAPASTHRLVLQASSPLDPLRIDSIALVVEIDGRRELQLWADEPLLAAAPGQEVVATMTLLNVGAVTEQVHLSAAEVLLPWAGQLRPPLDLALGPSEYATLAYAVSVPANASADSEHRVMIEAVADPEVRAEALQTIVVQPQFLIDIRALEGELPGSRGQTLVVELEVTNAGNIADVATLSVEQLDAEPWTLALSQGSVDLAPATSEPAELRLTVSPTTAGGQWVRLRVSAASGGDPSRIDTETIAVWVVPEVDFIAGLDPEVVGVDPGALVPLGGWVRNVGNVPVAVDAVWSVASPWELGLATAQPMEGYPLGIGETADVPLTLHAPANATTDQRRAIHLTVSAQGVATIELTAFIEVVHHPALTLALDPAALELVPGATAPLTLTLTNTGNGPDRLGPALPQRVCTACGTAQEGWVSIESVMGTGDPLPLLLPGQSWAAAAVVTAGGPWEGSVPVALHANSSADRNVSAVVTLSVTLRPPPRSTFPPQGDATVLSSSVPWLWLLLVAMALAVAAAVQRHLGKDDSPPLPPHDRTGR